MSDREKSGRAHGEPRGTSIHKPSDVQRWAQQTSQTPDIGGLIVATFVVDPQEQLLIADRHSEHVACAGGGDVLSAGEIFFAINGTEICIDQITNQSTGYCPEPESWDAVEQVLDRIGLEHPGRFTMASPFADARIARRSTS